MTAYRLRLAGALMAAAGLAQAQTAAPAGSRPSSQGWQACQALKTEPAAQLACFQAWADSQSANTPPASASSAAPPASVTTAPANPATGQPAAQVLLLPALNTDAPDGKPVGCRNNNYSDLSKFWELQRGTDCDTFAIRGYRPISLSVVASDSVNQQPSSPATGHTALTSQTYRRTENKIQLSVRTKVAKGLLKSGPDDEDDQDSLWFGYTQQSYWQLFNSALSRPFRSTDHEPEVIYIYPHQIPLAGGWNYRLSGLGLVHQSNGQALPLSRSWNRVYLMGAAEKVLGPESSLALQGRAWRRLREKSGDDDNPGIENYVGRAELAGRWQLSRSNSLGLTLRHSLKKEARGSARLDWTLAPASSPSYTGLRYHLQLFSGYGDSLLDYNRKRNVLSLGLSLVDW
ncbi:phospholipase A [Polaromonas sp.]|uniref:phospholipase A n=1 Tax=Polaromonas sp. TaxID=1869339 RepID=UPI00286A9E3A|nr:phospholipase A [Polaromonas sp.]